MPFAEESLTTADLLVSNKVRGTTTDTLCYYYFIGSESKNIRVKKTVQTEFPR
jgi:hypothetical protein